MAYEKEGEEFEIVTCEEVETLFAEPILFVPYKLFRINTINGARIYFRQDEFGTYRFYLGTTSLSQLLPMSPQLLAAWCKRGYEGMKRHMYVRSLHGSFFHKIVAEFAKERYFPKIEKIWEKDYSEYLRLYRVEENLHHSMQDEMRKDILSYLKWACDYKVKPLAVELALCSDTLGVATLEDCIAIIDDRVISETTGKEKLNRRRKGEAEPRPKFGEHLSITDFKTSKAGHFESHILQGEANQELFVENFPELGAPKAFYNMNPKNWRGTVPTYEMVNQTEKLRPTRYMRIVEDGKEELQKMLEREVLLIKGDIKFGENPSKLIQKMPIHQIIESGLWKEFLYNEPLPI